MNFFFFTKEIHSDLNDSNRNNDNNNNNINYNEKEKKNTRSMPKHMSKCWLN